MCDKWSNEHPLQNNSSKVPDIMIHILSITNAAALFMAAFGQIWS